MNMISYWKDDNGNDPVVFFENESAEATYIYGWYTHKGQNPIRAIGIYYRHDFPYVKRGGLPAVLSPLVFPKPEAIIFLRGLLDDLVKRDEPSKASKVKEALAFLQAEEQ